MPGDAVRRAVLQNLGQVLQRHAVAPGLVGQQLGAAVQVIIISTRAAPNASGSQAPSGIFSRFDEMKVMSISRQRRDQGSATWQGFHFQTRRAIT